MAFGGEEADLEAPLHRQQILGGVGGGGLIRQLRDVSPAELGSGGFGEDAVEDHDEGPEGQVLALRGGGCVSGVGGGVDDVWGVGGEDLVREELADDLVVLAALDVGGEEVGKHVVELAPRQPTRAIRVVFLHDSNQVLECSGDRSLVFWNAKEIDDCVRVFLNPEVYKGEELHD